MIPVLRPSCTDAEIAAVTDVLRSGWWGNGPVCAEFERQLAERYGRKHCVTTNSATSALTLALRVLGVGPGDEVIVPALTFVATALAAVRCGARPVFVDVDPITLCMNPERVLPAMRPGYTKAVVPVDFAGYPTLAVAADETYGNLPIVQDAAHSAGGTTFGAMTCLSFHPVKNLATGDGGAILLDDDIAAERLRRLRWCGISRATYDRVGDRYVWDYDIPELGDKMHWNDIQAAIGLVQLERLDAMNARRRQIAERYTAELGDVCETPLDHRQHTWHLYVIRVHAAEREPLMAALAKAGVYTGVHYKPVTEFAPFRDQPTPPVTAREWQRCVSLPIYADLTDDEQSRVIEAVRAALRREAA